MTLSKEIRSEPGEPGVRSGGAIAMVKKGLMTVGALSLLALLGLAIKLAIQHFSKPSDTPIVIGGGSIYGRTSPNDSDGWSTTSGTVYSASLHHSQGVNPDKIDNLVLSGWDKSGEPTTLNKTGGWAIQYYNRDGANGSKPNAENVCSNEQCNTAKCPADIGDTVYMVAGDHTRFDARQTGMTGVIDEVHFHDSSANPPCDGHSGSDEGACDLIEHIVISTCNQGQHTYKCSDSKGHCNIKIGNP